MDERMEIRLSSDDKVRLGNIARALGISASDVVRLALRLLVITIGSVFKIDDA